MNNVLEIIGTTQYTPPPPRGRNLLYLFARTLEESKQELVFITYDLDMNDKWADESTSLELPDGVTEFTAEINPSTDPNEPPSLSIWIPDGTVYIRSLSKNGDSWGDDEFQSAGLIPGDITNLNDENLNIVATNDKSGTNVDSSLATVGDLDGDGYDELIVAEEGVIKARKYLDDGWENIADEFSFKDKLEYSTPYKILYIASGDIDGDQQDEVIVILSQNNEDEQPKKEFFLLRQKLKKSNNNYTWITGKNRLKRISISSFKYAVVGDFDHDQQQEIAIALDKKDGPVGHKFNVYKLVDGAWDKRGHLARDGEEQGDGYLSHFAAAGSFNRLGDQIAINRKTDFSDYNKWSVGNDFWVRGYAGQDPDDEDSYSWTPLPDNEKNYQIDCSGTKILAKFATVGDFNDDQKDEIVIATYPQPPQAPRNFFGDHFWGLSAGNDFWCWEYDPDEKNWIPLGTPAGAFSAVFDCTFSAVEAKFAVAADIDGDGRDELIISINHNSDRRLFWIMKYRKPISEDGEESWQHVTPIRRSSLPYEADFIIDTTEEKNNLTAFFALAGRFIKIDDEGVRFW